MCVQISVTYKSRGLKRQRILMWGYPSTVELLVWAISFCSHHLCNRGLQWHYGAHIFCSLTQIAFGTVFAWFWEYTSSQCLHVYSMYINVIGWLCDPKDPITNMIEDDSIDGWEYRPFSGLEDRICCLWFPSSLSLFYFLLLSKGKRIEARTSPLLGLRRTTIFELCFQKGGFPCMTLKIFMDLSYWIYWP